MRKGGSYEKKGEELVLRERTTVGAHGARPADAKGAPLYQRPHETADETKADAPVAPSKAKK